MKENHSKVSEGYYAFIGRFQPLHNGHCNLINPYLERGDRVLVLIMDGSLDRDNPFTLQERCKMFNRTWPEAFGNQQLVLQSVLPIIDLFIGRNCGFGIRKLDSRGLEGISATAIRWSIRADVINYWETIVPHGTWTVVREKQRRGDEI